MDKDQLPENMASDQALHCLPFIQQLLSHQQTCFVIVEFPGYFHLNTAPDKACFYQKSFLSFLFLHKNMCSRYSF